MDSGNDMMPNDGELFNAFQEPEEQVEERRKSVSKSQAAKPMLEDLIALFEADITQLSSIDSIQVDIDTNTEEFLTAWREAQALKRYATEKKLYLESLLLTTRR